MNKKSVGISASRRLFLRRSITLAPVAAAAAAGAVKVTEAGAASGDAGPAYSPKFFNEREWAVLSALVDRLIPADAEGPGALEAGVPEFIDRQMDTPYGHGGLWYMQPPFREAPALFGYQLKFSPRELYRVALPSFDDAVRHESGKAFAELAPEARDDFVRRIEAGKLDIGEVPAAVFFGQLLQNTREGYFSDPVFGGNKGMAAWRMINFPGARADYMDWVEQYGKHYPLPPVSIA